MTLKESKTTTKRKQKETQMAKIDNIPEDLKLKHEAKVTYAKLEVPKNAKVDIECIALKKQFKHICRKQSSFFDVLKNFIVEKSMIYGSIPSLTVENVKSARKPLFKV